MFYLHFLHFLSVIIIPLDPGSSVLSPVSSSDVAYLDCVSFYKTFNFAASLKIEC